MRTPLILILALLLLPYATAELRLDDIQFDPAIIASGDTVDIVAQFHDESTTMTDQRLGNPAYTFKVTLRADDTLTENHVLITDANGDDLQGIITRGGVYNKRFRVKVLDTAPAGDYEFKLIGQWYRDGIAQEGEQYLRFLMPVKREGIQLAIANTISEPRRVRSGDKDILIHASIANSGEKLAKDVRITLTYPQGISSSYADGNARHLGVVEAGATQDVEFVLDTDRGLKEGSYTIPYTLTYRDVDGNQHETRGSFPFVVKKRPDIIIIASDAQGRAGDEIEARVTFKNIGEETADTVDARILKGASQPFAMNVRSDYIGELTPGEEGTAVFHILVDRDAEIKTHDLTILIRATGDSEEGDTSVYTYTTAMPLTVTDTASNRWPWYAGVLAIIIIVGAVITLRRKRKA